MTPMKVLLSRWQFGVTITYHFLFVPLTIGLALLVAVMQVLAYRKRDPVWERLTWYFGVLFLINFAMGVVTGIVQEFQFGMNWSNYSVFVGNIFGAPLAMEGLLAFFAESTFIAVWLFGRHRLPPLARALSICVVSVATVVSAFFILTANAWMQHPVGYRIVGHQAQLTDFWAVLRNPTLWAEWTHTVLAAFVTGAMFVLGVSAWRLLRGDHVAAFTRTAKLGAWVALAGVVATMVAGDWQARLMDDQQPMKMAAAEAVYRTQHGASFSLLTIGNLSGQPIFQIRIPHLLSLIATLSWNGKVVGVAQAQHDEVLKHGPGSYVPVLWVTYWSFRLMVGLGFLILIMSAWALWRARRGGKPFEVGRWTLWVLVACIAAPFAANTFGWLFTEMGRQPWIVYGLMKTGLAGSPSVSATDVAVTLGGFVFVYTALGVTDVILMYIVARRGLGPDEPDQGEQQRSPAGQPEAGELIY
ncbi:MAG TPA: cytochrome ubiquinol oxidase subunit I [Streptosporangiaceae bacterium]|jgi:cytochrome d ubiquinol oxidase subunit I|nr:cytochrome ubiquinol oxidase subunit I [Streptosporangiaceae bacterium]